MSHQDAHGLNPSTGNLQDLSQVLDWLLSAPSDRITPFQRDCSWTPKALICAALLWAWSDETSLTQRFVRARKIIIALAILPRRPAHSYQAFLKMLRRWTLTLTVVLLKAFRHRMETDLADRFLLHGYTVFGVDGSRIALPRTQSNEQRFSPAAVHTPKSAKSRQRAKTRAAGDLRSYAKTINCPQMWLTTMFHVGSGLPWDWRTGPSDSSERDHMQQMIAALPAHALITADAGFVGYAYWKTLLEGGRDLLIRVGSNVRLLQGLGYVKEHDGVVYLWPNTEANRNQPPLVLRLVVAAGGRHPVYLVTSVSGDRLSDHQVLEIYARRWGVELFYRHFKQTFDRHKLRSHIADHVELEATWSLIGLWAMSLRTQVELAKTGLGPERISVAGMLRAYRQVMHEYRSDPDAGESLGETLQRSMIDTYRRGNKASRNYPRKKSKKSKMVPKLLLATPKQINKAKAFVGQTTLGLTA